MKEIYELLEKNGFILLQIIENIGRSLTEIAYKFLKNKKNPVVVVLAGVGCKGAGKNYVIFYIT